MKDAIRVSAERFRLRRGVTDGTASLDTVVPSERRSTEGDLVSRWMAR